MSKDSFADDKMADALVKLVSDLVTIPTESPGGANYGRFVDCAKAWVDEHLPRYETEVVKVPEECYSPYPELAERFEGPRLNLLLRPRGGTARSIHVNAHYDVVPAGEPEKWSVAKPFSPVLRDGRIYGRGTSDMKGSIACLLKALEAIEERRLKPRFSVEVSLTCDEEYGEYTGLRYLVDQTKQGRRYINSEALLSLDGGFDTIGIGGAGFISYKITTKGRTVHSSAPHLGVNAIFASVSVLQALRELSLKIESRWSAYPTSAKASIPKAKPCLNVTLIRGGHAQNAIPESCTIEGDRRVIPDEEFEQALLELNNTIIDAKLRNNLDLEFQVRPGASRPYATDPENEYLQQYRRCATRALARELPVAVSLGSTDVSRVKTDLGVDTFSHGAADEQSRSHGYDESVSVENLKSLTEILVAFVTDS